MSAQRVEAPVVATVGFAARPAGDGVAYVSLSESDQREASVLRVEFACRPQPALQGRDVAYAAAVAIVSELLRLEHARVVLRIDDGNLVQDLEERRPLPAALTMPYVRLRCALNRFRDARIVHAANRVSRDLVARARAEALLDIAA